MSPLFLLETTVDFLLSLVRREIKFIWDSLLS